MTIDPKDEMISFRTKGKYKRKAKTLPCTYEDIFVAGLEQLSKEINRLEHEKGELELQKATLEGELAGTNARITAINNRIRIIAPSKLDKETLSEMIGDASEEYAQEIFAVHKENSFERIQLDSIRHSVLRTAREWGYDGSKFLELVEARLNELCNTGV